MIILGLTGSIGMGKTTAAAALRQLGVPVLAADAAVHRLTKPRGRALPEIEAAFPGTVHDGILDRGRLAALVFGNDAALTRLEAILHPLFASEERRFLAAMRRRRRRVVAIDIPLLYEIAAERHMDAVIVVSAPPFVQRGRVMARRGMTAERFAAILARQMPDREKRKRADFIVNTGGPRREALRRLAVIVDSVRKSPPRRGQRRRLTTGLF